MTLLGINENLIQKARCEEMPEKDHYIFVYDSNGDITETKYWEFSTWTLKNPAPLMPTEYMTSESWEQVLF